MKIKIEKCQDINCGSKNQFINSDTCTEENGYTYRYFWVTCVGCGKKGPEARHKKWALEEWNREQAIFK